MTTNSIVVISSSLYKNNTEYIQLLRFFPIMQVYCTITSANGVKVPTTLPENITPTALRKQVSEATKIPLDQLRLIFRGKMIKDDDTKNAIEEFKLEPDCVLHCMGKPVSDEGSTAAAASSSSSTTAAATSVLSSAAAAAGTTASRPVVPPLSAAAATTASVPSANAAARSPAVVSTLADPVPSAIQKLRLNNPPSVFQTALVTLEKILSNIVSNPMEEKYRKVKRNNAAFSKRLGGLVGGHDVMLAVGFLVGFEDGAEVYQLHASPEQWPKLCKAKDQVEAAVKQSRQHQQQQTTIPSGTGSGVFPGMMAPPTGAGWGGGMPPMDPNMQNTMTQMMSDPQALRAAMQVG
jgi:hypothetical protein